MPSDVDVGPACQAGGDRLLHRLPRCAAASCSTQPGCGCSMPTGETPRDRICAGGRRRARPWSWSCPGRWREWRRHGTPAVKGARQREGRRVRRASTVRSCARSFRAIRHAARRWRQATCRIRRAGIRPNRSVRRCRERRGSSSARAPRPPRPRRSPSRGRQRSNVPRAVRMAPVSRAAATIGVDVDRADGRHVEHAGLDAPGRPEVRPPSSCGGSACRWRSA